MISFFKDTRYDWHHFFATYKKYVKTTDLVVEVGASFVEKTDAFASLCHKLIGVEYKSDRLPKNHQNISYIQGDWQNLSKLITKNSVDILISNHTIEHIVNDSAAINETYKVLKNGGIAILNTPNRNRLVRSIIEIFSGKRIFPFWEHQREYSETDLQNLISKSLFKKYRITPIFLGFYNGYIGIFLQNVPNIFKKYSNFWEIELYK